MSESFGARLRQQRENRGVALAVIAKQTRIKETLLEALERDDLSLWPTGFYRRAFFRAYASAIQLDPDVTFREFQAVHPEPPEVDVMTAMAATLGRAEGNGRSLALRGAVESAFSSFAKLRRGTAADSPAVAERPAVDPSFEARASERTEFTARYITPASPPVDDIPHPRLPPEFAPVSEPASKPAAKVDEPVAPPAAAPVPAAAERSESAVDLMELARLCGGLGCVTSATETESLLADAARALDASGLIVWAWDARDSQLHPALYTGYSPRVVAQLPMVRRDDDNATAAAFRTAQTRIVNDPVTAESAFVIPLRTACGCVGVFAVELKKGCEPNQTRLAIATLLATPLAPIADCLAQPQQLSLPHAVNGA